MRDPVHIVVHTTHISVRISKETTFHLINAVDLPGHLIQVKDPLLQEIPCIL